MKRIYTLVLIVFCFIGLSSARTIYVSTSGNDSNPGTEISPYLNIQKSVDEAQPGDMIYLRGGTYMLTKRVKIEKAGTEMARISMFAYPGERVIIDGTNQVVTSVNDFKQARCFYVNHFGDYWHFKNLEFCNAKDNGLKLEGSYNIVENCKFYNNNDTGLQIGMYKDFSIEETQSFPISGEPQFNPNYSYCKYNQVINCDAWNNYDSKSFSGSDDGGDADGFACKLFPGPGTEFHGCRAWNNSDDNWDLYMVYHPIVIEKCWSWNAGKRSDGSTPGNGNGFKLGGGGTAGGAAFAQSVGAHVVHNCVAFDCAHKGFDQNNAYEAMYLFNNVSFGNEYNYRFPTIFMYGTMYMRNNIGFKPTVLNHEFLSIDKVGAQVPNTDYNSWTTFDGCDPYKDGNKVDGTKVFVQDHAAQFKSVSSDLFLADRQTDGSLPDNDFCKLITGSKFINAGENVENFSPAAHSPGGLTLAPISILYNDGKADMGAFETGDPTTATFSLISGKANQFVFTGTAIQTTIYKWGGAATDVTVSDVPAGLIVVKDAIAKTVTISGIPTAEGIYSIVNVGGTNTITLTGTIKISTVAPAILQLTSGKAAQEVFFENAIETMVFTWGGGATDVTYTALTAGLQAVKDATAKTLTISGIPSDDGLFAVSSVGGMEGSVVEFNCNITRVLPTKILTGDWYHLQDSINHLPADLQNVLSIGTTNSSYPTVLNPVYVESTDSAPSGCTIGAINVERSGGYVQWTIPSLVELKSNIHFTGTRTLNVEWTIDGVTKTWTSASLSKQTMLNWDLMLAIGLEPTKKPVTIKFINTTSSGGIRMYDFYVQTYDVPSVIESVKVQETQFPMYQTETALIVYGEISSLKVFNLSGRLVSESIMSQLVETNKLNKGVYLVQVKDKAGRIINQKFIKN
ncbi:MAG: right-handed parallel beta-helix repeat-containing protein [Paludibacter sp.]|nr:right-handed parallel beta-helix repeat-containing protein [Paludibacter sp.]